eukprot:354141-Chlamydomonas_euryale.AAC.7
MQTYAEQTCANDDGFWQVNQCNYVNLLPSRLQPPPPTSTQFLFRTFLDVCARARSASTCTWTLTCISCKRQRRRAACGSQHRCPLRLDARQHSAQLSASRHQPLGSAGAELSGNAGGPLLGQSDKNADARPLCVGTPVSFSSNLTSAAALPSASMRA